VYPRACSYTCPSAPKAHRFAALRLGALALASLVMAACASVPPLQPRASSWSYAQSLREADVILATPQGSRRSIQLIAAIRARLGDHDGAISEADAEFPVRKPMPSPDLSKDRAEDAIAAILREAAGRQIVILNENHYVPMHRAFSMRLARELRKLGFEYLAAEAFSPFVDLNVGALVQSSGGYLADPVFAEFIRDARRDGWKLVGYEAQKPVDRSLPIADQIRQREREQAQNLVDGILKQTPGAKIFIHVGFGHVLKTPQRIGSEQTVLWMAGELRLLTGIDPLTIDQSLTFEHPDQARELPGYRAALAQSPGVSPFVLKQPDGGYRQLGYQPGSVDMQVFHPPSPLIQGRSGWLTTLAERRPFPVPDAWLPKQGRRLIYAMHEGDPPQAIPADIVILEPDKPAPALMLPAGKFRFEFEELNVRADDLKPGLQ